MTVAKIGRPRPRTHSQTYCRISDTETNPGARRYQGGLPDLSHVSVASFSGA